MLDGLYLVRKRIKRYHKSFKSPRRQQLNARRDCCLFPSDVTSVNEARGTASLLSMLVWVADAGS